MRTERTMLALALAAGLTGLGLTASAQDTKKGDAAKGKEAKKPGPVTAVVGADVYTVTQYRTALSKMAGFLGGLDAGRVFQRFRGTPPDAEYDELRARVKQNLEISVRYRSTRRPGRAEKFFSARSTKTNQRSGTPHVETCSCTRGMPRSSTFAPLRQSSTTVLARPARIGGTNASASTGGTPSRADSAASAIRTFRFHGQTSSVSSVSRTYASSGRSGRVKRLTAAP